MKKIFLVIALTMSVYGISKAQTTSKALGVRFSYNGGEISYQHPLGKANRFELDLGVNSWGFGLNGIYQWVWDLSDLSDGFNWYAGVGGIVGTKNTLVNTAYTYNFGLGVIGQVGIEYNFDIPFQLSLDYRPGIYFAPAATQRFHPGYDGICLSARYRF